MIRYSHKAMTSYGSLMEPYNDIDVYVEDSTYIGVYEKLINRILDGRAKVTRVIPLGPRSKVLEAAKNDKNPKNRKKLYIVDGDLDLIAYKRNKSITNVHYLSVYCFENLVWERDALNKFISLALPGKSELEASRIFNLDELEERINDLLVYFIILAVAYRLKLRGKEFSLNPPSVSTDTSGVYKYPCSSKIRSRALELSKIIRTIKGRTAYKKNLFAVLNNISYKNLSTERIVSGKSFLMWYLGNISSSSGSVLANNRAIVSYLAEHCSLQHDDALRRKLHYLSR